MLTHSIRLVSYLLALRVVGCVLYTIYCTRTDMGLVSFLMDFHFYGNKNKSIGVQNPTKISMDSGIHRKGNKAHICTCAIYSVQHTTHYPQC